MLSPWLKIMVSKHKKHLVAAIGDIELYRVDDDYGCSWVREHQGLKTHMSEKAARMFYRDARRMGEVFDVEELED